MTEPYFDEGAGNISMVSLTTPVFDSATNFIGVAGVDLALDRIRDLMRAARPVDSARSGTNGFAYLVSRAGKIIAHPDEGLMLRKGFAGAELRSRPGGELVAATPEGLAGHKAAVGVHTLHVWHEVLGVQSQQVTVTPGQPVTVDVRYGKPK